MREDRTQWQEIAPGVFVRRYPFFDQTIGAIVGDGQVLVIDTRTTYGQARELQDDLRTLTPHPWVVVNTHHHFDHTFGNALFRPADIWGHERCAETLLRSGEAMRERVREGMPELAAELAEVEIVPPTRTMGDLARIEIGGRPVELRHLGRGHTDNDIVIVLPDATVLFAGDLVEQGAPPSFGDSYPLDWPAANAALMDLAEGAVVPGHGEVVDHAFVAAQTAEIQAAADAARAAFAAGGSVEEAMPGAPFPEPFARACIGRAFAQLAGSLPSPAGPPTPPPPTSPA